jgi:hypothetical protein
MTGKLKFLGLAAVAVVVAASSQTAFANCQNEGPYEVRQCAKRTWFAPVPGAGNSIASVQWWAVGFGNNTSNQSSSSATVSPEGSGFLAVPPLPGNFIGVDSGDLNASGIDLVEASTVPGVGGPVGAKCLSSSANWGSPGMDSCIDINRNDTAGGGALNVSDNYVNIYWDPGVGLGTQYFNHQLDPPMGILAKDASGTRFALAFFATEPRNQDANDVTAGQYNMGLLVNGDPGPTGNNVVPWQTVPEPNTSTVLSNPLDPDSPRNVTMSWTAVRLVTDNSTRPCIQADNATPCSSISGGTGVGTNDVGALVHYEIESAPLVLGSNTCGTTWTLVPGTSVDHPATTTSANGVPANTCVRLKTRFGHTPSDPCSAATTTCRDQRRLAAQTGAMGDIGYSVASTARRIGGPTVSQNAVLKVAAKNKNMVTVSWDTTSELSVTGFDIVGIDAKGDKKTVASSVGCKQCTNGLGASYTELVPLSKLSGSKKVQIVMQPSGTASNTLDIQ